MQSAQAMPIRCSVPGALPWVGIPSLSQPDPLIRTLAAQAPDLVRAHGYLRTALALAKPHR
jgi:hypothetical protein